MGIVRVLVPDSVELRAFPAGPDELLPEVLRNVTFLAADFPARDRYLDLLADAPALRVVQVLLSGTDWIVDAMPCGVTLCNARGTRDVPVSEWVLAALLGATSGLLAAAHRQAAGRWQQFERDELAGRVVLVVGMGSIGTAVRDRLAPFGVRVIGVARSRRPGVVTMTELPGLLGQADAVVLLLPHTEDTHGLVDRDFLARMRDGALLVNAGRGPVVDTTALTQELATGRLRAILDVTHPEPLPPEHPLWRLDGVTLSPHIGGNSLDAERRAWDLVGRQIARFSRGEPLANVVPTRSSRHSPARAKELP